jgi:lysophospholipase L1-like esterase
MKKILTTLLFIILVSAINAQTTYIRLSSLPSSSLLGSTLFPVQDASSAGYVNRQLTLSNLNSYLATTGLYPTLSQYVLLSQISSNMDFNDWSFYNDTLRYNGTLKSKHYSAIDTLFINSTGSVVESSIVDGAVTPRKTSFAVVGKNKFNMNDPNNIRGYFMGSDGTLYAGSSYSITGYIPIITGQSLYCNANAGGGTSNVQYDIGKNVISGASTNNAHITGASGVAYVRFTLNVNSTGSLAGVQIENYNGASTSYPSPYLPYTALQVITPSIADTSIPYYKTKFLTRGKNLFNSATANVGYFVNWSTGQLQAAGSDDASDYIRVTAGQTYMCNTSIPYYAVYDSNQVFVSGNSGGTYPLTIPTGCWYIRISLPPSQLSTCQFEAGTASTTYVPYTYVLQDLDGVVPITVGNNVITPAQTSNMFSVSKNLFNSAAAYQDCLISWVDGSRQTGYYGGYASYFIPVTPGAVYTCNTTIPYRAFYNSSQVFVSGKSAGAFPDTIPAGCYYTRITMDSANIANLQAQYEAGSNQTFFVPYGYTSNWQYLTPFMASPPVLKWASDGDSITGEDYWQPAVAKALNIINTNLGIAGTTVSFTGSTDTTAMCSNYRIGRIPSGTNIITLLGGTNDWAQNIALGDTSSSDSTTFCGALNIWVKKVITKFPTARIFLLTTTYGELYAKVPSPWVNAYTNTLGLTTRDYANAVKLIGQRNSIPVIDLNEDCGWNTYNIRTFLQDDGALLHPNSTGAVRMSNVIIKKIQGLLP